jgi:hypothetical protein
MFQLVKNENFQPNSSHSFVEDNKIETPENTNETTNEAIKRLQNVKFIDSSNNESIILIYFFLFLLNLVLVNFFLKLF